MTARNSSAHRSHTPIRIRCKEQRYRKKENQINERKDRGGKRGKWNLGGKSKNNREGTVSKESGEESFTPRGAARREAHRREKIKVIHARKPEKEREWGKKQKQSFWARTEADKSETCGLKKERER